MNFMENWEWDFKYKYNYGGGSIPDETIDEMISFIKSKIREAVLEYDRLAEVKDLADSVDEEFGCDGMYALGRKQALADFGIKEK